MFLLYNYEKVAHLNNYGFFWKGLCFNYLISTLRSYAGSSEGNLFWVDQFDTLPPPPPNLHIGRKTNPIVI